MIQRTDFVPVEYKAIAAGDPDGYVPLVNGMTVPGVGVTKLCGKLLDLQPGQKLLLIGTGSGYQTAWLAEQYGVKIDSLDIRNYPIAANLIPEGVRLFLMDGMVETPKGEVYDAILCTCGVPAPMLCWMEAVKEGGVVVAPVGGRTSQALRKYVRVGEGLSDMGDFAYARWVEGETIVGPNLARSVFE